MLHVVSVSCHRLIYAALWALACVACGGGDRRGPLPAESFQAFTKDGAWCWFSDPRAVYYEGRFRKTYTGWVDSTGNIVVGSYDHDSGNVDSFILHADFERDDHDNPSLIMDTQGKLVVFYSRHSTGSSPIFMARASVPESIDRWDSVTTLRLNDTIAYRGLSNTYTYTNIVRLAKEDNRLYLFWRGADFKPNVSTSDDGGKHWSPGRIFILPERTYRDRRPYLKVATNGSDEIHFAFTDGHPNAEPANSIYYATYREGALFRAGGEKIADLSQLPMNPATADLVYDASATGEKAWIWDVAADDSGTPVVVYSTFPSDTSHVYYYGIYHGGEWHNHRLVDSGPWFPHTVPGMKEREPNYSGGIVLDHANPAVLYLSRRKEGVFEIEKWVTPDKGENWDVTVVTAHSAHDNVRPFVIRGQAPRGGPGVLWMNVQKYRHYTDYRAAIRMDVPAGDARN